MCAAHITCPGKMWCSIWLPSPFFFVCFMWFISYLKFTRSNMCFNFSALHFPLLYIQDNTSTYLLGCGDNYINYLQIIENSTFFYPFLICFNLHPFLNLPLFSRLDSMDYHFHKLYHYNFVSIFQIWMKSNMFCLWLSNVLFFAIFYFYILLILASLLQ